MRIVLTVSILACLVASRPLADAQQGGSPSWRQWGGPERTFQLAGRGLHWKGAAPRKAWQRDLGEGYAAIVGDAATVYAAFRQGDAMHVANSTPLLADGRLFVVTFTGRLCALDAATGRTLWTRELWADLKGTFRDVG